MASEHYHELVFDYLYGLLEPAESQNLRAHVEICHECRTALAEAESQQQMLARAARVIHEVPAFSLPGQEPFAPSSAPETPVATLPFPAPRPHRSSLRRYWPAWAAAAVVLAGAFGLNEIYQKELAGYEAEVNQRRHEVEAVNARFAALAADVKQDKEAKARLLQEQVPPQLQVMGPAQFRPEAPANYNVSTRDQSGQLRAATVTTTLIDPATNKVLHKQTDAVQKGEGKITIPEIQTERPAARMEMEAKTAQGTAKIEETLRVAEPTHASHLALNKSLYYVGDLLFFRSLTLDRVNLKPPAHPLALRFALVDANGRTVKEMPGQTGPGGVSGGEMALTPDLVSGNYSLQINAADGVHSQVLPQIKNIEIVREETPLVEFDRNQYKPGDQIGVTFRGGNGVNNYANQTVNITVNADGQAVPQAANLAPAQVQTRLDNAGNSGNFKFQLPEQIKNGAEIVIDLKDGQKDNKLIQAIPVFSSAQTIDLFPEGGELVAGLPNRVYYRVRTLQGENVEPDGKVTVQAGAKTFYESEPRQGLGSFIFTPDPKEAYSVRITGSQNASEIQNPFQKLGIQSQGVVLNVPESVGREGEAVNLVLHNQGPARKTILEITCRGQIVDQQYLDLSPGRHQVKMQPVPGSAGILRVTVMDVSAHQLIPIAERLLYRAPAKRLDVSCQITNGPGPYAPGTHIAMTLKTADENKNAAAAWMLAAVVDDKFRAEKKEPGLISHFYLASDIAEGELDNANLVLNDAPASYQALDWFLGTQGWRRFAHSDTLALSSSRPALRAESTPGAGPALGAGLPTPPLPAAKRAKDAPGESSPSNVTFFSLQNITNQNLQNTYQSTLQKEVTELTERANQHRATLLEEREASLQLLEQAKGALAQFQQQPGIYLRLALGIVTLGLLMAGALFLALGLVRLLRKNTARPSACFAGAIACLLVCSLLYLAAGSLRQEEISLSAVKSQPWPEFDGANIQVVTDNRTIHPSSPAMSTAPPPGYYVAQTATSPQEHKPISSTARGLDLADNLAKRSETVMARAFNFGVNQVQNNAPADQQRQLQESAKANDELRRRFASASAKGKETANKPQSPPGAAPTAGGFGGQLRSVGQKKGVTEEQNWNYNYFREYAHRGAPQPGRLDLQDTLLWHPTLFSKDGNAQVSFDLSQNQTTYRILIYANSPDGRLGFYEGRLEARVPKPKE